MLLLFGGVNGEGVMFSGSVNLTSYSHNVFDPSRCRLKISAQGGSLSSSQQSKTAPGSSQVEDLQEEASIETEANEANEDLKATAKKLQYTETETHHLNSKGEFTVELAQDTIYQVWIESLDFHMKPSDRFTINSSNVESMKPIVIQQGLGQIVSRERIH
ncbi:unnamed protein product [Ambrosiozyma monospora]|uniref:Unnamed protein product n=1 Tax=Ambrosiozyma monospora TaxID=43982 RepID=A0ACB5T0F6_AMBMO|nr:unnamed protein product [Ambrosiozyma monospora]